MCGANVSCMDLAEHKSGRGVVARQHVPIIGGCLLTSPEHLHERIRQVKPWAMRDEDRDALKHAENSHPGTRPEPRRFLQSPACRSSCCDCIVSESRPVRLQPTKAFWILDVLTEEQSLKPPIVRGLRAFAAKLALPA